jgi:hypothetical protein
MSDRVPFSKCAKRDRQMSNLAEKGAFNLFVTSKNETTNSPIHKFKVLHTGQRAFQSPFLMAYYFLFITLKTF